MKIVIDIPEDDFYMIQRAVAMGISSSADRVIYHGTPLPKGHGRLIDADKTHATALVNFFLREDEWRKKDKDFVPIGRFYCQNGFDCCLKTFVDAPAIIEADKEVNGDDHL